MTGGASHFGRAFRAKLVLMILGRYGFGDHVSDPQAFSMRVAAILGRATRDDVLVLESDDPEYREWTDPLTGHSY